eukprot:m.159158 g.159158  ORF g.159158 m.159158 type:complete len:63 (+) comp14520_c0_seq4:2694-2882(+)
MYLLRLDVQPLKKNHASVTARVAISPFRSTLRPITALNLNHDYSCGAIPQLGSGRLMGNIGT